jgi:hypothetical protein
MRISMKGRANDAARRSLTKRGAAWALALGALLCLAVPATFAACHSQTFAPSPECSDPCCGGNPTASIDCALNPTLTCTASGDPCTAVEYGCANGQFFSRSPATLPATCPGAEAGASEPDGGGVFTGDDGESPEGDGATGDGGEDASVTDAASDALTDGDAGAVDSGDAGNDAAI